MRTQTPITTHSPDMCLQRRGTVVSIEIQLRTTAEAEAVFERMRATIRRGDQLVIEPEAPHDPVAGG
ncbi:MAG TPA: hypothetical protein VF760_00585 [Xanthobacteraceae bacterium]